MEHTSLAHIDDNLQGFIAARFGDPRNLHIFEPDEIYTCTRTINKFVVYIIITPDTVEHDIARLKAFSKVHRCVYSCSAETCVNGTWLIGIGYVLNVHKPIHECYHLFRDYPVALFAEFIGNKLFLKDVVMYYGQKQGKIYCYNQEEHGTCIPRTNFYYFSFNQFPSLEERDAFTA